MRESQFEKSEKHQPIRASERQKAISRRSLLKGVAALGMTKVFPSVDAEGKTESKSELSVKREVIVKRIDYEVARAGKLIEVGEPLRFFESLYLISALYYSERFLKKLIARSTEFDVSEEIISLIALTISPRMRELYMLMLDRAAKSIPESELQKQFTPLERFAYGRGKNHPDAIDLFVKEGTPVRAMRAGVIVLSDSKWDKEDQFSTASLKGGNSVIIYNSTSKEFYRYCHLKEVFVNKGQIITAGTKIGTVGHSGTNASKPGHGEHLHFEINQYIQDTREVRPLLEVELKRRIDGLKGDLN